MYNIAIIGLGLIGGSIAKALINSSKVNKIIGFDTDNENLQRACQYKCITSCAATINEEFSDIDIIFICTPVKAISNYVKTLKPFIKSTCIITDVGSTKLNIVNEVERVNKDILFVGGHPMVGSEKIGFGASKGYLFENAYYIITKSKNTSQKAVNLLEEIVVELKAIPIIMELEHHDYITSAISHVPHVIASSLVRLVQRLDTKEKYMHTLAAGGFKDITRITSSSPLMWQNISQENKEEILKAIAEFKSILNEFEYNLTEERSDSIYSYFEGAKQYRDSFGTINSNNIVYDITVDVVDRPGAIAEVSTLLSQHNVNIKNIGILNNREHISGILKIVVESNEFKQKSIEILKMHGYEVYP